MDYTFFVDIKNHLKISEEDRIGVSSDDQNPEDFYRIIRGISETTERQNQDYSLDSGISKLVVICKDYDKVLKIPYNGCFNYDRDSRWECNDSKESKSKTCNYECWDCEYGVETDYEDEDCWEPFGYADCEDGWNYCESELSRYEKAEENGFEMFLAKTEYFGETKKGYPLYLQEKIPNIGYSTEEISQKSKDQAKKINTPENPEHTWDVTSFFPNLWIAAGIEHYGEEITKRFLTYAHEEGLDRDMHSSNYGYRADGSPVIIDFSGYEG